MNRAQSPHVNVNIGLMFAMTLLHFATIVSATLNGLGMLVDLPWSQPSHDSAELAGQASVYIIAGIAGVVGLVWAPLNAWALLRKKPWARKSCMAYWGFTGVFCCCLPGAAYGLWSLSHDDVKAALAP
jgi:hypothetical protein